MRSICKQMIVVTACEVYMMQVELVMIVSRALSRNSDLSQQLQVHAKMTF